MNELYINIKSKRLENSWSQTELAAKAGYSDKSMIAKIEAGKVDLPQSKIKIFADVFNCSESDLMGWNNEETNTNYSLSLEEAKIINAYRSTDSLNKQMVKRILNLYE